ncbi:hypothetical protein APS56_07345 [Pseudalgibacter alginicilyticus]|uniref:Putative auto-transporter adhesin head GIN domain-containing protein n=1 Tax=Pseudalgibacter alginicilyticus TaxID=1736674 RepID=A0A0P0D879_9FLAO|nr:head GIN domain-containing protein [Pseudalgibacter alginicilyticus]ALJ04949.1 hypothetical protein APS56_07345 [Pseudalgibacter alginicilyticus]
MKKIIYILLLSFIFACDSENANDCFQKTGSVIQNEMTVNTFNKILVNRDIELILKEGPIQKLVVETGENLFNDVEVSVVDEQLILTDNNSCNYVRDYGITKVYITSPNITEIRSSTQYDISSEGVLTYPDLTILSEDFWVPGAFTVGNFNLNIDNDSLTVVFNSLSNCFVTGKTNALDIGFYAGTTTRFEGRNLVAQNVKIYTRSSNDIIVNPQLEITGVITGTGDVISVNTPPIITVETPYRGQLILE